jgi:hypothetical protein
MSPAGLAAHVTGCGVLGCASRSVPARCVADRLDLAAPQAGHDQLQALPPPIHVQQGLGLVKDPVAFGGSGHGLRAWPGHRLGQVMPELS